MQKINSFAHKTLFMFGERLALLLVITAFASVIFLESAIPAFSEEDINYEGYSKNGLTYDFHLSTSYTHSTDTQAEVIVNYYEEEEKLEYVEIEEIEVENESSDVSEDVWVRLADCESGRNWSINTGNGYYGGLQFSEGAWNSVGGTGLPHEASREEQIKRGKALQQMRGWGAWGLCAQKLGLN